MKNIFTPIILFISSIFGVHTNISNTPPMSAPTQTTVVQKQILATSTKSSTTTSQLKIKDKTVVAKKIKTTATTNNTQTQKETNKAIQVPPQPQIPFETLNVLARKAVVNILCSTESGGPLFPISGSGVVIGGNGVILTNAHIGQFFLLKDFNGQKNSVECKIRTGSPAYPTYNAELIYISPSWIENNKTILIDPVAKGTGEHDYALLRITGKIDGSQMPDQIPYLSLNLTENNSIGTDTLLASYPAGFLGGQSILRDLYQSSATTAIKEVFTFGQNTIDLISIPGTVVSQKGSSGGAVVDSNGNLIGIISTESEAKTTGQTDLRAITLSYINRDLKSESGSNLVDIIAFPAEYAKNFNDKIAPKLTEILTNAILKK